MVQIWTFQMFLFETCLCQVPCNWRLRAASCWKIPMRLMKQSISKHTLKDFCPFLKWIKLHTYMVYKNLPSAKITQGNSFCYQEGQFENPLCAVVISFCACHYRVICCASALTMKKDALIPLHETRSPDTPMLPDTVTWMSFRKDAIPLTTPQWRFETGIPNFLAQCGMFWSQIIPLAELHKRPFLFFGGCWEEAWKKSYF